MRGMVTRRAVLRSLLGGGGALALGGGVGVAQGYRFGVTRHTRALPGLRAPLRAAFLTDLHYGLFIGDGSVGAWVEATNDLRADVILLGGDLLDARLDAVPPGLLRQLARLRAPLGTFSVWGNHDYGSFGRYGARHYGPARPDWMARRERFAQELAGAGVTVLRDEGRPLRDDVWVGGTDDLWFGKPDAAAALAGAGARATLLVTHNPDLLPALPRPVGLVLCGHTHGGQVRLPLLGAPMVPSAFGQRYAMGWVTGAHDTPAYVSRGLGLSGLPVRNLCEPEVTLLQLSPP
ncbi:putative metallophosphoesterase [Deinococcus sedimenti]|uniref:Metallophosphoesterase n=2 Tax=Deinococcus sedimenti TaxID=1867090 RepID=A0ABQ2S7G6_9DEIO|nr:putative metallophosphoesterase [Deinococcus sedimenti]